MTETNNFVPLYGGMHPGIVIAANFAAQDQTDILVQAGTISDGENGAELKPKNVPHIMCVDDEQDILSVATLSLETVGGYRVSCCSSGVEAVERAAEIAPNLILLDVMMPQMGGPATLQALRANAETASIPVVFMTARVQPHEVEEYLELGASAVVHKPFDPMQLPGQIGEILKRTQSS